MLLAGCNAISGIYAYQVSDDDVREPRDGSSSVDASPRETSSGADRDPPPDGGTEAGPEEAGNVLHVFVTSTKTNGSLGGLAGGNSICRDRANAAGRPGNWVAWLSATGDLATSRVTSNGPWYLFNGTLAVASREELTSGGLTAPINVDENGTTGITDGVWTGTSGNGTAQADCSKWSVPGCIGSCPSGMTGKTDLETAGWTGNASIDCLAASLRLYCFQN